MKFIRNILKNPRSSEDGNFFIEISEILGFKPENIDYYKIAFTNRSMNKKDVNGNAINYERLEFVGDAMISAVVAGHLFNEVPEGDEGYLTKMRSKIVSRHHLNKLAVKLGLDEFISEDRDTMSKSVYGDAFEALVGAIYLDRGYKSATNFIINRILEHHVDMEELEMQEFNFKGKLIDWGQKERKEIIFELMEEIGDGYGKKYKIAIKVDGENWGEAVDFSKKKAEQKAAEVALRAKGLLDTDSKDEK